LYHMTCRDAHRHQAFAAARLARRGRCRRASITRVIRSTVRVVGVCLPSTSRYRADWVGASGFSCPSCSRLPPRSVPKRGAP